MTPGWSRLIGSADLSRLWYRIEDQRLKEAWDDILKQGPVTCL